MATVTIGKFKVVRRHLLAALTLWAAFFSTAQVVPVLKFNDEGKFKIVQFTDIHYKYGKGGSKKAIENMNNVLDAEQPDFVIITGDLVYADRAADAIRELLQPITSRNLPFATVFGNHDVQFDLTLPAMYDSIRSYSGCVMPERGGSFSPDYVVKVLSKDGNRTACVLYCMDSHSVTSVPGTGKYDWIKYEQIGWYRNQSDIFTTANGGKPLPALAFFHIPLPEFAYAEADTKSRLIGTKGENICCPALNSGLFTVIKEKGDVIGVFCGHDHDNDFAVGYFDVLLAYGRYSGGDTVYNHLKPKGARIIELNQDSRIFDTWLRLADGSIAQKASFPTDFTAK